MRLFTIEVDDKPTELAARGMFEAEAAMEVFGAGLLAASGSPCEPILAAGKTAAGRDTVRRESREEAAVAIVPMEETVAVELLRL